MATGINPPGMQQRFTGYTFGEKDRFQRAVSDKKNREQQLEVLSAQLKVQKDIADERNRTTIEAAGIRGTQELEQIEAAGKVETGHIKEKGVVRSKHITEEGAVGSQHITQKGDIGSKHIVEKGAVDIDLIEKRSEKKKQEIELQGGISKDISQQEIIGRKDVTEMQTTSAEKRNLDNINARREETDKKLAWARTERTLIEGGLDGRQAKDLSTRLDLANLSHTEAMKRLEKELGTRVNITKMKEDGSLARMVKQIQSNEFITKVKESGAMDRIVQQLTSRENLAGLDNEAKMERLKESLLNDNVMQRFIQSNLNKRQLVGIDAKKELTQYVEGEAFKRLNLDLESREAIQVMLEQGRNTRDQNQFMYNTELQLDRANQQMALQIEDQEHQTGIAEQKFEQAKELGNVNFERDVLRSILNIKMKGEAERQSFNFLASPFSLGKTSGILGINYKEQDVLDQVGKNLPALSEAVRIARNIPDEVTVEKGGWFSKDKEVSTMVPKKDQLFKVLENYEKELSGSQFYNWGESMSTKKDAKAKLGDIRSLMMMLRTPSKWDMNPPSGY